jgi:hypothetical protein
MRKTTFLFAALVICVLASSYTTPAFAQAVRTWVSGVGDDANPCSRTAPCKTFAGSISKTAAGGEINCLDPGGFGTLTITKSISILCNFTEGGVSSPNVNGFTVNMPNATDRAVLDGLDIDGAGTGLNGVRMIGQGKLIIRNSSIKNVAGFGVDFQSPAGAPAPRVLIQNSFITNAAGGFNVQGVSGAALNGQVINTLIDSNVSFGIQVNGVNNIVVVSASTVTGNNTALVISNSGQVVSYGNNVIRGGVGVPTSTLPLQ